LIFKRAAIFKGWGMKKNLTQDITLALYSSLDLETSLHKTLLLLREYIPADLVHVFTYDINKSRLSYLAEATEEKGILIDESLEFENNEIFKPEKISLNKVFVLESNKSRVLKKIRANFQKKFKSRLFAENEEFSVLMTGFDIVHPLLGGFGIVAKGLGVFNQSHIEIIENVKRQLAGAVLNLLHHREVLKKNEELSREKEFLESSLESLSEKKIIGSDKGLKHVFNMIKQVASMDSPVLISGETGTGKELCANAVHKMSKRNSEKMVKVNCGAIHETLMDSELFGHEKGAFTGAFARKTGFFEQADKGTVFLDEIGELSLSAQAKLLRVLQSMEFQRVGGSSPVSVDVRVVAATNRDLLKMVKEKKFRKDLWFRLNVFPVSVPPLRKRKEDIKDLCLFFTEKKSKEMNLEKIPRIEESSLEVLKNYNWPGNVRELENVVERALILRKKSTISFDKIIPFEKDFDENRSEFMDKDILSMDEMVKQHIVKALKICDFKIEGRNGAAELLEMNPSTLRSKMKKYSINLKKEIDF
jgi:transcriptional regulator with GAF, ATPase, and Fis domain